MLLAIHSNLMISRLLEVVPIWILLIKLPPVVGEEEKSEDCKEDAPEGSPQTESVQQCLV